MYLMKLQAKEKFSFLQLAHYLARIDNSYGKKEEEIILEYCLEMGIENLSFFDEKSFLLEDILKDFKSKQSKRIVVLELLILVHIDGIVHLKEEKLINLIINNFGLEENEVEDFSIWAKNIAYLYEQGKNYIKK